MFKRNLVPYLIRACKQQHLIKLIVLFDVHQHSATARIKYGKGK